MFSTLLDASQRDPNMVSILITFIVLVFFVYLLGKLLGKSKKATQTMLIMNMNKYGPGSWSTISTVTLLVKQMFKSEGIKNVDVDLVYEMGNRYQGTVSFEGRTYDITVIADRTGSVHYKINGAL